MPSDARIVTPENFGHALNVISRCRDLTVDLETTGLHPYHGDRLFAVAVEAEGTELLFPFRHMRIDGTWHPDNLPESYLPFVLGAITREDVRLLGHNFIRFDCPMIAAEGEQYARRLLLSDDVGKADTIIDALLANENEKSFSLEALGLKYLSVESRKSELSASLLTRLQEIARTFGVKTKMKKNLMGYMKYLTPEEVTPYACNDVTECRLLRKMYEPYLERWHLTSLSKEMYQYARLLARIERTGMRVDVAECHRRAAKCDDDRPAILQAIREDAGLPEFNPQSPIQVRKLCGTADAEAETLILSGHPLARKIVEYKRLGKVAETYYRGIAGLADVNGIIHPQMNVSRDPRDVGGTRSGRLSCSNPNFQNLPKRSKDWYMQVRDIVLAREGRLLYSGDYERAEMWLGGHYSGDASLYEAYHQGRNLYKELALNAGLDPVEDYTAAKIGWLGIQYGAGAKKVAQMFGWPFEHRDTFPEGDDGWDQYNAQRSVRFRREFFDLCPGIKQMMYDLMARAEQVGSLRLWTGRVIHFDGKRTRSFAGWNRMIQGGVGEMVRLAMQRLEKALDTMDAEMVLQVHDEVVVEGPVEREEDIKRTMKTVMETFDFRLRPRVDVKTGISYGRVA